jgi:hypothetical protein
MTKFALLGAALLATALASPALAQAVVEDPGYCAQFYPNSNCQNYGPGNPLYPQNGWYNGNAQMHVWHHPHHWHHHHR